MAISTRDGLIAAIAAGPRTTFCKSSITTVAGRHFSLFRVAGRPSSSLATPGTAGSALSRTSSGALVIPAPSAVTYLNSFQASLSSAGVLHLYDRLVETGGLSGTVTTAQTVGSAALPARATAAVDVELWLEVYTALGSTPSPTVTASYTNQAGTAGRTATLIGGIPASLAANSTLPFTLQAGDTGVQSVQSVTSTTSTLTAGSFGVTLRRLIEVGSSANANGSFAMGWAETGLGTIPDDACLELVYLAGTTSSGILVGAAGICQG